MYKIIHYILMFTVLSGNLGLHNIHRRNNSFERINYDDKSTCLKKKEKKKSCTLHN